MWLAIIVIFVQILVHEYGHYLMAVLTKVPVLEFSVGFGPKLLQKKTKNGMLVTLRAFPIGGYCNVKDLDEDTVSDVVPVRKQIPIYLILQ